MLPETLEYLQNEQANLASELGRYNVGSDEWNKLKKSIDGLNETMKDELNRQERQEKADSERKEAAHEARMEIIKDWGKIAIPTLGFIGTSTLVEYMNMHPESMPSQFVRKVWESMLRKL